MKRTITVEWTDSFDKNDKRQIEVSAEVFGPIAFHREPTRVDVLNSRKATGLHQITHIPTGLMICTVRHTGLDYKGLRKLAKLLGNDPVWDFTGQPKGDDCRFLMCNLRQYMDLVKAEAEQERRLA